MCSFEYEIELVEPLELQNNMYTNLVRIGSASGQVKAWAYEEPFMHPSCNSAPSDLLHAPISQRVHDSSVILLLIVPRSAAHLAQ